jgi:hypothetical protein
MEIDDWTIWGADTFSKILLHSCEFVAELAGHVLRQLKPSGKLGLTRLKVMQ